MASCKRATLALFALALAAGLVLQAAGQDAADCYDPASGSREPIGRCPDGTSCVQISTTEWECQCKDDSPLTAYTGTVAGAQINVCTASAGQRLDIAKANFACTNDAELGPQILDKYTNRSATGAVRTFIPRWWFCGSNVNPCSLIMCAPPRCCQPLSFHFIWWGHKITWYYGFRCVDACVNQTSTLVPKPALCPPGMNCVPNKAPPPAPPGQCFAVDRQLATCQDPCKKVECPFPEVCVPIRNPLWSATSGSGEVQWLPSCVHVCRTAPQPKCTDKCNKCMPTIINGVTTFKCVNPCSTISCAPGFVCTPAYNAIWNTWYPKCVPNPCSLIRCAWPTVCGVLPTTDAECKPQYGCFDPCRQLPAPCLPPNNRQPFWNETLNAWSCRCVNPCTNYTCPAGYVCQAKLSTTVPYDDDVLTDRANVSTMLTTIDDPATAVYDRTYIPSCVPRGCTGIRCPPGWNCQMQIKDFVERTTSTVAGVISAIPITWPICLDPCFKYTSGQARCPFGQVWKRVWSATLQRFTCICVPSLKNPCLPQNWVDGRDPCGPKACCQALWNGNGWNWRCVDVCANVLCPKFHECEKDCTRMVGVCRPRNPCFDANGRDVCQPWGCCFRNSAGYPYCKIPNPSCWNLPWGCPPGSTCMANCNKYNGTVTPYCGSITIPWDTLPELELASVPIG